MKGLQKGLWIAAIVIVGGMVNRYMLRTVWPVTTTGS